LFLEDFFVKKQSRVVHPHRPPLLEGNDALVSPLYLSVKYSFPNYAALAEYRRGERQGYDYARRGNPSTHELELLLAEIQGREECVCTSTGLTALSTLFLATLKAGDHAIILYENYASGRLFLEFLKRQYGIEYTALFFDQLDELEKHIRPGITKLLHFESPTNPSLRIPDIQKITQTCRQYEVLTSLDNTLSGFHNHGQCDIDIFVHSLTKFASGHSDAMGGALIGNESVMRKIRSTLLGVGDYLAADVAGRILRGMKTYYIRYQAQSKTAHEIAEFLQSHALVAEVRYPGLVDYAQHELAKEQQKDFGAVIFAELRISPDRLPVFFDSLKFFELAPSLGSVESMIVPLRLMYSGGLSAKDCERAGISETSIRLAIGIEHVEDLKADLIQALAAVS
jgi:cystathionine beta-lyase/cystathionine gamma-synthase